MRDWTVARRLRAPSLPRQLIESPGAVGADRPHAVDHRLAHLLARGRAELRGDWKAQARSDAAVGADRRGGPDVRCSVGDRLLVLFHAEPGAEDLERAAAVLAGGCADRVGAAVRGGARARHQRYDSVRRAPLDGLNAQDLALLAAAISASVLVSLVAVAGWGVAMLVQAPGALTGTAIIGWVVMLALIIAGLIPAIGALRRCPLGALRGSQSDDSRDPAATT